MRCTARVLAIAVLALPAAACGGSSPQPNVQRALDAFLVRTPRGRELAKRFPHKPGSIPCTVVDPQLGKRVAATCSTDVSNEPPHIVATFTVAWSHGSRARTLFVFLRADGTVVSVTRAGAAP